MAVDKTVNDRYTLTLEKEFKKQLQEYAKEESRTLNSFIVNALKVYVKNNFDKEPIETSVSLLV